MGELRHNTAKDVIISHPETFEEWTPFLGVFNIAPKTMNEIATYASSAFDRIISPKREEVNQWELWRAGPISRAIYVHVYCNWNDKYAATEPKGIIRLEVAAGFNPRREDTLRNLVRFCEGERITIPEEPRKVRNRVTHPWNPSGKVRNTPPSEEELYNSIQILKCRIKVSNDLLSMQLRDGTRLTLICQSCEERPTMPSPAS